MIGGVKGVSAYLEINTLYPHTWGRGIDQKVMKSDWEGVRLVLLEGLERLERLKWLASLFQKGSRLASLFFTGQLSIPNPDLIQRQP